MEVGNIHCNMASLSAVLGLVVSQFSNSRFCFGFEKNWIKLDFLFFFSITIHFKRWTTLVLPSCQSVDQLLPGRREKKMMFLCIDSWSLFLFCNVLLCVGFPIDFLPVVSSHDTLLGPRLMTPFRVDFSFMYKLYWSPFTSVDFFQN